MGSERARWGRRATAVAVAAGAAACSQASAPRAPGDDFHQDVDATALPPQPDAGLQADSPFSPADGSYGTTDGSYVALTVCAPPDASADGAAPRGDASASDEGGSYATGCQPFPAACASEPDCVCLIQAFGASLPCEYPSCVVGDVFTIYCP